MFHLLIIILAVIGGFVVFTNSDELINKVNNSPISQVSTPTVTSTPSPKPTPIPTLAPSVNISVPFVSQAPTGRWSDPRQQDGCEEAASYMAYLWVKGESKPQRLTDQENKIIEISDWEEETYGSYHDTSAKDTAERILKGFFKLTNYEVKYDIKVEDIRQALSQGNVVLVPADGQALSNPNFTPPGPERHFLLIRGYDLSTDEFITNDNGTRKGEGYRYKTSTLMNAIRDYPTGNHEPITQNKKAMIVVKK